MMNDLVPVILNGVVIVLLIAAIAFGIRLHRRLAILQSAQSELAALLGRLDDALAQASSTVSALKYSTAKQLETAAARPPAPPPAAEPPRAPAPVQTIKTAPTKVEVAKPAPPRRRKPFASLVGGSRTAADELMAVRDSLRNAG